MKIDRLVLDSNVLISAILTTAGTPARLFDHIRRQRAVLLFSDPTRVELRNRLLNPRFDRYVSQAHRMRFLAEIDAVSEWVGMTGGVMGCRDRDDDKILETALNGRAQMIVSGDQDLLVLHPWRGIPVLSPGPALELMTG
jgi:putative PIN family toxin of toxin-antitoxin system